LLCEFDPFRNGDMREIDQHSPGELPPSEHANLFSLIETVLEHLVGLEFHGTRLVHLPPEQLVALHAGGVAGLGEAVWSVLL
jgi:hypothetical protein